MGNAVPRMCHREAVTATATTAARCSGNADEAAAVLPGRRVATARSWQGGKVRRQRGVVEQERAGGGGGAVATVVTLKVVMTRNEAEKLIAWLGDQSAKERKARMAELTGQLRAGDGGGCRSPEAWTPRLAPIQEN